MPHSEPCRCPGCLPSIPPDPATATPAELLAHAEHRRRLAAVGALTDPSFQPYAAAHPCTTEPTAPIIFQADERLAQHLLSLGFTETTSSAYHKARGWRSFYHPERYLSVWLQPNLITLQQGENWRHEAGAQILATTLDFLLNQ